MLSVPHLIIRLNFQVIGYRRTFGQKNDSARKYNLTCVCFVAR